MSNLFFIYRWLIYVPYLVLSTIILGACTLIANALVSAKFAAETFVVAWAKSNAAIAFMKVKTVGLENIDPRQSYIIVANHQSLFDIFVMYGWLGIDIKWVIKKELRKAPIIGYCCEALNHVFIDRSNRQAALASLEEAKRFIVDGTSIIFFPEGTRSKTGKLGTFKKGAFRMALDMDLPLLPVTLSGTNKILPSGSTRLMPGTAKMIVHPPISLEDNNANSLSTLSKEAIASGLQ